MDTPMDAVSHESPKSSEVVCLELSIISAQCAAVSKRRGLCGGAIWKARTKKTASVMMAVCKFVVH